MHADCTTILLTHLLIVNDLEVSGKLFHRDGVYVIRHVVVVTVGWRRRSYAVERYA